MHCSVPLTFLLWCSCQHPTTIAHRFLPPPLQVTCPDPQHVYQKRDTDLHLSCLWDGQVALTFSRAPQPTPGLQEGGPGSSHPPHCQWFQGTSLLNRTDRWSGQLLLSQDLDGGGGGPDLPQARLQVVMQCLSWPGPGPPSVHSNLTIDISRQDVVLFLLSPRHLPIREWQPVAIGWCAHLKSPTWSYQLRSQGGHPASLSIPSNQYREPLASPSGSHAELPPECETYYNYQATVHYPQRGFYTVSLHLENGPPLHRRLGFSVQPALLHVFSASSGLLSQAITLSWRLQPLSSAMTAYTLADPQGLAEWTFSHRYNAFARPSHFCAASRKKVIFRIYFCTLEKVSQELRGRLDFANDTLMVQASSAAPMSLRLNPQKTKVGTYIFSQRQGLSYSTQEAREMGENSSRHYLFYEQASLSHLVTLEFTKPGWFRLGLHLYLNQKGSLFRSLGEKELDVLVFNRLSPDKSLVYLVWFIPVPHPDLQCEWAFHVQLFDSRKEHLLWNKMYTYQNRVKNAARFLPQSVLSFQPTQYAGFVAEVNCTESGLAIATLTATVGTYATRVMEPPIGCQKSYCSKLAIVIHKPSPSDPVLSFRREKAFKLEATAKTTCRRPPEVALQWTIYKRNSAWPVPDWPDPLVLPEGVNTGSLLLHIPGNVLAHGFYQVNLTLRVHLQAENVTFMESDSAFFQILENNLMAVLDGGLFQTLGVADQWSLDGAASSDPDAVGPLEGLLFHWFCSKRKEDYSTMTLSPGQHCHSGQEDLYWTHSRDPVQMVQPKTLQENMTYYFMLVIRKQNKSACAFQTVHILPGSAPTLDVSCLENCGETIRIADRFILYGRCLNCKKNNLTYFWTLLSADSKEVSFDWASKTTTGRTSPYLHVDSLAFRRMSGRFYALELSVSTQGHQLAVSRYPFYVHTPPQLGQCLIKPREGIAFRTKFTFQCTGFGDKNGPLTYKVIAHSDLAQMAQISTLQNNTLGPIVYIGQQPQTPPSFLPSGSPSEKYALNISVQVYDADGAFVHVQLQATVYDSKTSKPPDVVLSDLLLLTQELKSFTSLPHEANDYLSYGYQIYMVASELNRIEALPVTSHSKTELRETLLSVSLHVPMTEISLINQVISGLCQIMQNPDEVSRTSQSLAVSILRRASEALRRHRDVDLGSREAEGLTLGIFAGLSQVVKASRRHLDVDAVKEAIVVSEILADLILQGKVPAEEEITMEAQGWSIHLWKNEKGKISRTLSKRRPCKDCFYPQLNLEDQAEVRADGLVSVVQYTFEENPFPWLAKGAGAHTAVTGFRVGRARAHGGIPPTTPDVTEVVLDQKEAGALNLMVGWDKSRSKTTGGFSIEVNRNTQNVYIQIMSHAKVTFNVSFYLGLDFSRPPIVSYIAFPDRLPLPQDEACPIRAPYILCLPRILLAPHLQAQIATHWNISVVLTAPPFAKWRTTKMVRVAVFTASCMDLGNIQNIGEEEMCRVGPQTNWTRLQCLCGANPKGMSHQLSGASKPEMRFVSGTFVIYPNPLDFDKVLLADIDANPVTLLTVFFIFSGYIFCTSWAIIKDKDDMRRKNKIFALPDNDPYHRVHYIVTIYTGSRKGSGTTADVFLELIGEYGASDVHRMKHPKFVTHFRAAIDTFLLSTKHDLGDISTLHIWHNNAGSSPNWYLSRVKVFNVQTQRSWLFMCRKWLGLGKADGKIERFFPSSMLKSRIDKMDYFLISLARDLEDNHLWLSIFSQVVTGNFNRVQRVSCCLAIILSTLLLNIMFFNAEEREVISLRRRIIRSIYIGFISALFCIPLQLTCTMLFRYSMEKPTQEQEDIISEFVPSSSESSEEEEESSSSFESEEEDDVSSSPSIIYASEKATPRKKFNVILSKIIHRRPLIAWYWRYVSWVLVFLMSSISSVFIILYGLTYGYSESIGWFISSITSFFQSVFLLQTVKMCLISAVSTISRKYCKSVSWIPAEQYQKMKLVRANVDHKDVKMIHHELVRVRHTREYEPLEEDELVVLRKKVRAQHLAFVFVKDIVCHLVFASCILSVTYTTNPTISFYYNKLITQKFSHGLSEIMKLEDIYVWMTDIFTPLIHNDYQPTYLSETWSKILGLPRMRQIRAQHINKTCLPPGHFTNLIDSSTCRLDFYYDTEDQKSYLQSWTTPTVGAVAHHVSDFQGFTYESELQQWEYRSFGVVNSYGPGGYSFYFFPREQAPNTTLRLENLQNNQWLDNRTWAVIVELTIFNCDIDLYSSITVIFEATNVGMITSRLSVHSYKLTVVQYETYFQFSMYGVIVYILIFYLADEFHMIRQERIGYFKTATNLNNFAIKTICLFFILLIALKYKLAYTLLDFYLLHPEEFVPFHVISQIDQLYGVVCGILAFLLVLKPYRYFRFLYKMRLAERTMAKALQGLFHLSILAILLLTIYMSFGHLLFGQHDWNYNSWIHAFQTVLSYCHQGLRDTGFTFRSWLGIFFISAFIVTVVFILINFWKALIISNYTPLKQKVYEQHSDEAEAINFVVVKIQEKWRTLTRRPRSKADSANVLIFGKPVIKANQPQGLRRRQIEGKKYVYLSV